MPALAASTAAHLVALVALQLDDAVAHRAARAARRAQVAGEGRDRVGGARHAEHGGDVASPRPPLEAHADALAAAGAAPWRRGSAAWRAPAPRRRRRLAAGGVDEAASPRRRLRIRRASRIRADRNTRAARRARDKILRSASAGPSPRQERCLWPTREEPPSRSVRRRSRARSAPGRRPPSGSSKDKEKVERTGDYDPDIAGIIPGPQPLPYDLPEEEVAKEDEQDKP